MRTGKIQGMIPNKKKPHINEFMGNNSKRIIAKNLKKEYFQLSKSTNQTKNFQMKQYIDMTVTHFTCKCTLLCNEIEEMKKEFVNQLQGIVEGFQLNETSYPLIKGYNKIFNQNLNYNKINLDNGYVSTNYIDQYKNNSNLTLNKDKFYLNNNDGLDLVFDKNKRVLNSEGNTLTEKNDFNSPFKNNSRNKNKEANLPQIKSLQKIKNSSNKEKAIKILMKSKILSFEDKLKIKFLNHSLYKNYNSRNILNSCKKEYEKKIKKISAENKDLPTLTSTSVLNFLKKEKKKTLKENNEINKKFINLMFTLSEKKNNENSSLENQYNDFCKELKVDSIKQFYQNYLRKVKENINDINNNIINSVVSYLENNKELIEPGNNELISLFSFSIKEIFEIFKFEKKKRKRIIDYQTLIDNICKLEKNK